MKLSREFLTTYQLFYTLKVIYDNDCYEDEFYDDNILQDFLETIVEYDIAYIASDKRVLLTTIGEKMLQKLIFSVELSQQDVKVNKT